MEAALINKIETEEGLIQKIDSIKNPNIFFGNGFNICLGVDISYESLWRSIFRKKHVKDIISMYPTASKKNSRMWI